MKQFFTLAAAVLVAFSANAEISMVRNNSVSAPVKVENHKVQKQTPAFFAKSKKAKAANIEASAFNTFLGDYVHSQWCLDPNSYEDWIGSNTGCQIVDNGDGTVTVKNILGFGDIQATYNAEDETLSAAPGQYLFESVYGGIGLFPFTINEDDEVDYSEEDPIVFYIDDENRLMIENDGILLVIIDGDYAGYSVNDLYMFNQFDRVNATMSFLDYYEEEYTLGVAVDGDAEQGYVNVYGFGDVSCIAIEIDGTTASVPAEQSIYYYDGYGMFYIYPITERNGSFSGIQEGPVAGTYDAQTKTISLVSCCGYAPESDGIYDVYYNPVITMNEEDVVAIEQIKNHSAAICYDLQGRIIEQPAKGQLCIQGNNKMIQK